MPVAHTVTLNFRWMHEGDALFLVEHLLLTCRTLTRQFCEWQYASILVDALRRCIFSGWTSLIC